MKTLIYTDIPLCKDKNAGNVNALLTLLEHFSNFSNVDVLSTHHLRPNRKLPSNVKIVWRPDLLNLAVRKIRRQFSCELPLFQYKVSMFKKWVVRQSLRKAAYDLIIIEYVENEFLLGEVRANTNAPVICDMHDLMSQRAKSFAQTGRPHKENLSIEPAEEFNALSGFDAVIALQAVEAAMVKAALPDSQVVVTRRPPPVSRLAISQERKGKRTVIGFLGTEASFNVDAATRLISREYLITDEVEYIIGGRVGDCIKEISSGNIKFVGEVESIERFYDEIDILANLIGYGSGLKTKNLEALAHGVPVITTTVGAEGMEDLIGTSVYIADSADEFRKAVSAIKEEVALEGCKSKVRAIYNEYFSLKKVFSELDTVLKSLVSTDVSKLQSNDKSA